MTETGVGGSAAGFAPVANKRQVVAFHFLYQGLIAELTLHPAPRRQAKDGAPNGETFDQVAEVIRSIRTNPDSRRHIINAWNVAYLPDESKSPVELFSEFFELQNNRPMSEEQREIASGIIEKIWEEQQ